MGEDFKTFEMGVGDENVGAVSQRWSGETGRTARFSFIWWAGIEDGKPKMEGNPMFVRAFTHFIPNVGYVVNDGPEYTKLAGKNPTERIATVIVVWPTDKHGNVDKNGIANGSMEVKSWVFSGGKYNNLKKIHREFPFHSHDITVECQDSKFQKLIFTPCRENLLKMLMKNEQAGEIVGNLFSQAAALVNNISGDLGQKLSIQQIQEKLAGGPAAVGTAPSVVADAFSTEQVDSIVGDLLG